MGCLCKAEHGYLDKRGIGDNDIEWEKKEAAAVTANTLQQSSSSSSKASNFYQDARKDLDPEHQQMMAEDVHVCK